MGAGGACTGSNILILLRQADRGRVNKGQRLRLSIERITAGPGGKDARQGPGAVCASPAASVTGAERRNCHVVVAERHATDADSALDHEHREDRRCSGLRDAEPLTDLPRRAITASETRKDRVIELPPEVLHTDMLAAPRCRGVTGR
jgi:hypothetical protein